MNEADFVQQAMVQIEIVYKLHTFYTARAVFVGLETGSHLDVRGQLRYS